MRPGPPVPRCGDAEVRRCGVLKAEDNEILTRVGPGTLMGELLRRYWTPACLTAEVPDL